MRTFIISSVLLSFIVIASSSEGAGYDRINPLKSSVKFIFTQMNVPVEGNIGKFTAKIFLDPARPETSSVSINLDMNSIDVGNIEGNTEVKKKNWFDTSRFESASFVSQAVRRINDNQYEVTGNMNLKGRSKPMTIPFSLKQVAGSAIIDGTFQIKRLEWGIGEGIWSDTATVADDVHVRFQFTALAEAGQKK